MKKLILIVAVLFTLDVLGYLNRIVNIIILVLVLAAVVWLLKACGVIKK